MHLPSLIILALTAFVCGQNSNLAKTCIEEISNKVKILNEAESKITAENIATSSKSIQDAGKTVLDQLDSCVKRLNQAKMITMLEAVAVEKPGVELGDLTKATMKTLESKKDIFKKSGKSGEVKKQLDDLYNGAKGFRVALMNKLPAAAKNYAGPKIEIPEKAIQSTIAAFT